MSFDAIGTSLPGLDQIQGTKSKYRKRLWTVAFLIATMLALYQSAGILLAYFDISTKDLESVELDGVDAAATLCINDPISDKNVITADKKLLDIFNKMKNMSSDCDPWNHPTLFCLSLLSERERFAIGASIEKIARANYLSRPDNLRFTPIENTFNNLYYGNCATVGNSGLIIGSKMHVQLVLEQDNNTVAMVLHRRNTVPVFNSKSLIVIDKYPIYILYSTEKTIYEDTTLLFNRACAEEEINQTGFVNRQNTFQYYKYSYESCLDQCLHNLTKKYCKCIRPQSMMEVNTHKLPICQQWCNSIPNDEMKTMCKCKPSCQQINILPKINFLVGDYENVYIQNVIIFPFTTLLDLRSSKNFSASGEFELKSLIGIVKRQFINIFVNNHISSNIKNKQLPTKLEDALSATGGIWGLWIGLSVSAILHSPIVILQKIKYCLKKSPKTNLIFDTVFRIIFTLIWVCILLILTALSMWQVYLTIKEYQNYKVIQVTTTEDLNSEFFPPVVACSETKVHFSQRVLNNPNLSEIIKDLNETPEKIGFMFPKREYYRDEITIEEKLELLPKADDFIASCQYRLRSGAVINCHPQNHPVVINEKVRACAFINPMFSELSPGQTIRELIIKFSFPHEEVDTSISAIVNVGFHPFVVLPVQAYKSLNLDVVSITPGDYTDAKYSVKQSKRLPNPYASDCINETADYNIWPSDFKEILPLYGYTYNYENCLLLCGIYQLEKDELYTLQNGFNYLFKTVDDFDVNYNLCGCKLPCKFEDYDFQISQSKNIYKENFMLKKYKNYDELTSYLWTGHAVLRMSSASSSMKVITEKPLIERDSLVGLVGGIFGLWIGVSIVSLLVTINNILAYLYVKIPLWFRHLTTRFQLKFTSQN